MPVEESGQQWNRMREDMSGESNRRPADRQKRVQTLKKLIILMLIISILIPCVCCIILFVRVSTLNKNLQTTTARLEELGELLAEQQMLLEAMTEETNTQGAGILPVNEAGKMEHVQDDEVANLDAQEITHVTEKEAAHRVYLTFDDGPSIYTDDILDILEQYDVKATFFVVGKEDDASKEALKQIVEKGHTLGMHSYSHKYKEIYKSVDDFGEDFEKLQNYLYDVTGVKSSVYRFPGGSSNKVSDLDMQIFANYLQEQGVVYYDWNISSGDTGSELLSVRELVNNSTTGIGDHGTSIILMHDSGDKRTTVEALPIIIENILAMEDTVILPITEDTEPVQHINALHNDAKE